MAEHLPITSAAAKRIVCRDLRAFGKPHPGWRDQAAGTIESDLRLAAPTARHVRVWWTHENGKQWVHVAIDNRAYKMTVSGGEAVA